jgi:hypothetical protein
MSSTSESFESDTETLKASNIEKTENILEKNEKTENKLENIEKIKPKQKKVYINKHENKLESTTTTTAKTTDKKTSLVNMDENNTDTQNREWKRSTRIDRKLSDIYYISGLYGRDKIEETTLEIPKTKKKVSKKRGNKKVKKIRSKSATETQETVDFAQRKKSISDSDNDSTEKKTVTRRKSSSTESELSSKNKREPTVLHPTKIENRNANDGHRVVIRNSLQKLASHTTGRVSNQDYLHNYLNQDEAFYKRNENTFFIRSLKKDMYVLVVIILPNFYK